MHDAVSGLTKAHVVEKPALAEWKRLSRRWTKAPHLSLLEPEVVVESEDLHGHLEVVRKLGQSLLHKGNHPSMIPGSGGTLNRRFGIPPTGSPSSTRVGNLARMREERIETDGIPAKVYDPGRATALLLLGHGGSHGKDSERFVHLSRRYAEATGLAVVCIDAVDHGERKPPGVDANVPPRWHSNAVDRMIEDWRTTVESLSSIGPSIAYVGFSMGVIFGLPTVAAMPSVGAARFVVGGIPAGRGIDDPQLASTLLDAASKLDETQVLMLNKTRDEIFPTDGTYALVDRIPGQQEADHVLGG